LLFGQTFAQGAVLLFFPRLIASIYFYLSDEPPPDFWLSARRSAVLSRALWFAEGSSLFRFRRRLCSLPKCGRPLLLPARVALANVQNSCRGLRSANLYRSVRGVGDLGLSRPNASTFDLVCFGTGIPSRRWFRLSTSKSVHRPQRRLAPSAQRHFDPIVELSIGRCLPLSGLVALERCAVELHRTHLSS
jgi:hypothetical protein